MSGPDQRPALSFWERAERERQMVRAVQVTEWRRRMLRAGAINPADLSDQALRILAWLAEWDDWTVGGAAELLAAAHRAGLGAAGPERTARRGAKDPTPADAVPARLAALGECPEEPGVEL